MSEETPIQLIVAAFQQEDAADNALDMIVRAKKDRLVKIREAAVVRRDTGGKLHIKERGDLSTGAGAASGATMGAVIGLFGGPLGALVGGAVGGAIGGLAARLVDTGIPDKRLHQIGESLQPGTSAIIAMIEHTWVDEFESQLKQSGADILAAAISEDVRNQLAAGKDVAYSAVTAAGGTIAGRTSVGEDGISVQTVATDGQNIIAGTLEAVKGLGSEVADTAVELVDEVSDTVKDLTGKAKDTAASAGEAVAESAEQTKQAVEEVADKAKDA